MVVLLSLSLSTFTSTILEFRKGGPSWLSKSVHYSDDLQR